MDKLIQQINRFITHPRDTVGDYGIRTVIHIPVGIVLSIPVFGWGLILLFIYYQWSENKWTSDQAWKDVNGAMVGFVIGLILQAIIAIIIF